MTDSRFESCIMLIRQGSKDGLREIYDNYMEFIYSIMFSAVKQSHNAEDLTSDFFLKLWNKLAGSYEGGKGHKRWLASAARNMAIDFLRKNGRELLTVDNENEDEDYTYDVPDPSDTENTVIGSLTVGHALEKLNDDEREIVNLKLFGDMTFKDISLILDKPQGTVSWKYRNAMAKLRKYAKEVQGDER
jgi:RNA polymerase sigma-70 factor (ECF subfamily)